MPAPFIPDSATLFRPTGHVERDSTAFGVNRPIDVSLVGELRDVVPQLQSLLSADELEPRYPPSYSSLLQETVTGLAAAAEAAPAGPPVHPAHLALEVSKALPENPVIIRDGGAICLWHMAFNTTASSDIHWSQNIATSVLASLMR